MLATVKDLIKIRKNLSSGQKITPALVQKLLNNIENLIDYNENLKQKVEIGKDVINNSAKRGDELFAINEELNTEISNLKEFIEKLKKEKEELIKRLKNEVENIERRGKDLITEITDLTQRNKLLLIENNELKMVISVTESNNKKLKDSVSNKDHHIANLNRVANDLQGRSKWPTPTQPDPPCTIINRDEEKIAALEKQIENLSKRNEALIKDIDNEIKDCNRIFAENERLKNNISALNAIIDKTPTPASKVRESNDMPLPHPNNYKVSIELFADEQVGTRLLVSHEGIEDIKIKRTHKLHPCRNENCNNMVDEEGELCETCSKHYL